MDSLLKISLYLGPSLHTRDEVRVLSKELDKTNETSFILDFEGVYYMSRSFADEFHQRIILSDFSVRLLNLEVQLIEILAAVARTAQNPVKQEHKVKILTFSNHQSWEDFMLYI